MTSETKICKSCQVQFIIEPDDFTFYEKIGVPAPTLCPECRMRRRMLHFNERALFKGVCKLCGKAVISAHRPDAPYPVYCQPCWWSDAWEPTDFGREYDFSRPFFDQFRELAMVVPLPALNNIASSNVRSEYVNMCSYVKDCYLCFSSDYDEECSFSCYLEQSKRCYDVDHGMQNELCYESIGLFKCYRVSYSANIDESMDVLFSRDLKNCTNCFGCINLRGKQYCMFNDQMTKETYAEALKKYDFTSYETVQKIKGEAENFFLTQPHKYMTGVNNKSVTGDYIFNAKNVTQSYDIVGAEDSKYCQFFIIEGAKNCMDVTMWGSTLMDAYECCGVGNHQNTMLFTLESWNDASRLIYCREMFNQCADLFGCIAMRKKQYCVLNKQYDKSSFDKLRTQIIAQMTKDGEYGEFFPADMSLFGYNESFANKYLPLTKEEALAQGFRWSEPEKRTYEIGGDVIGCEHEEQCGQQCTGAFRLRESEKDFYRHIGVPTPHLCPNCRHYERLKLRNAIKFYERHCAKCGVIIETSYSSDRPEMIYCEVCYQQTVN